MHGDDQDAVDLAVERTQVTGVAVDEPDERRDQEPAGDGAEVVELAHDVNTRRVEIDLLLRFAQSGRLQVGVVGLVTASGEGDVAAVRREVRAPLAEDEPHLLVAEERHEHGRLLDVGRQLTFFAARVEPRHPPSHGGPIEVVDASSGPWRRLARPRRGRSGNSNRHFVGQAAHATIVPEVVRNLPLTGHRAAWPASAAPPPASPPRGPPWSAPSRRPTPRSGGRTA